MNERLSLQDLIDLLAKKQEITKKDAEAFLRELIAVVSENIESNEPVKIKDFGTFKLVKVNTRKSVDVNTGEAIEIAAHYKFSFVPDKSLKEAINRPFAHFESVVLEEGVSFENIEKEDTVDDVVDEDEVSVDEEIKELGAISSVNMLREEVEEDVPYQSQPDIVEDDNIEGTKEEENLPVSESQGSFREPEETVNEIEEETTEYTSAPDYETKDDIRQDEGIVSEDDTQSEPEVSQSEVENEISQPLADIPDEWDVQYELEEQKRAAKRRRRFITLGFFIFLIIAGFLIGGLYFQEIAKYLTDGPVDNNKTVVIDDNHKAMQPEAGIAPADSLSKTQEQDSIAVSINRESLHPEKNDTPTEQPKKSIPSTSNINAPLATETIRFGTTLRNMALKYYGHKSFCVYIYEENKDKIKNINNIPAGTRLVIPSPAKYGINVKDKASVERAKEKERRLYREMGL